MRPLPRLRRRVAGGAVGLLALGAGCSLGAPDSASEEGDRVVSLWQGFAFTALAVGAVVWGLLIYVLVRYRRRRSGSDDQLPDQGAYNVPIEIAYTIAPVVIVAVLFGFSVAAEEAVTAVDDDADAVQVEVIGFQWSWEFRYPDEDVTIAGRPGEPPEMVLPVDRPAHLELVSTDVAHSFWVPDFLSKRDLIPGVDNVIQVTPTEEGSYVGRCAEFCGLDHWAMNFSVRVVPEAEYESWLAEQSSRQQAAP